TDLDAPYYVSHSPSLNPFHSVTDVPRTASTCPLSGQPGAARQAATCAVSAGWRGSNAPSGVSDMPGTPSVSLVRAMDGDTALTRTPYRASSTAQAVVRAATPALAAA